MHIYNAGLLDIQRSLCIFLTLQWRHITFMTSQTTKNSTVCPTVCSGQHLRNHHGIISLALRGIHLWPVDSPHNGPVVRKASWRHHGMCCICGRHNQYLYTCDIINERILFGFNLSGVNISCYRTEKVWITSTPSTIKNKLCKCVSWGASMPITYGHENLSVMVISCYQFTCHYIIYIILSMSPEIYDIWSEYVFHPSYLLNFLSTNYCHAFSHNPQTRPLIIFFSNLLGLFHRILHQRIILHQNTKNTEGHENTELSDRNTTGLCGDNYLRWLI